MINIISHNERDKTNLIECLKINNIMEYNAKNIANEFGNYFSSIGKTLATQIQKSNHSIDTYIKNIIPNPKTIYIQPTTKQEVEKLIDGLENMCKQPPMWKHGSIMFHVETLQTLISLYTDQSDYLHYNRSHYPTTSKVARLRNSTN